MTKRISVLGFLGIMALLGTTAAYAQGREEARLLTATQVLNELRATPDQSLPDRLLSRAYAIAIVPDVTKAAFIFGGRRGNGVLVARDKDGRFSDPIFVNLTGGSFGLQWGVESTDVVLVFTTRGSVDKIAAGKLTLGANASVAAGPVGRQAEAATDPTFHSEVYSYSRNRGLFGGIALDGSNLTVDDRANSRFYDKGTVNVTDVLNGTLKSNNESAKRFLAAVAGSTGSPVPASASAAPVGAPSGAVTSSSGASPASNGAAHSFPLEDQKPGQEPLAR
jgi:lipid-binding SYLF domain-containing protein